MVNVSFVDDENNPSKLTFNGKVYTLTPVDPDQELRDRVIRQIDINPYDNKLYDAFRKALNTLRAEVDGCSRDRWGVLVDEGDVRIRVSARLP